MYYVQLIYECSIKMTNLALICSNVELNTTIERNQGR